MLSRGSVVAEGGTLFAILLQAVGALQAQHLQSIYRYQCMGLEGELAVVRSGISFAAIAVFAWPRRRERFFASRIQAAAVQLYGWQMTSN